MSDTKTTDTSREYSAEEKNKQAAKAEKEQAENQQSQQTEEDEEENQFGGLRGGNNFKKNLGCGG